MRIISLTSAVLVMATVVSCTSARDVESPARATAPDYIVNGTPTGTAYGSVGALLFDYNGDGIINGDDEW